MVLLVSLGHYLQWNALLSLEEGASLPKVEQFKNLGFMFPSDGKTEQKMDWIGASSSVLSAVIQ